MFLKHEFTQNANKWDRLRQRSSLIRGYIILLIHQDHQTNYLRPIVFTQPNKITIRPWVLFFMQHDGRSVSAYPRDHFTPISLHQVVLVTSGAFVYVLLR